VYVLIQFTFQVLPPSSENACSERPESEDVFEKLNLANIIFPLRDLIVEFAASVLELSNHGTLKVPTLLLAKFRLH
jgi:hypothetical protein